MPEPMAVIDEHYDESYVRDLLLRLARVPTDVPLGAFEIDPTDPKIQHFVHDVVRPEIERLGFGPVMIDELNNLVIRVGSGVAAPTLLFMAYTVAQHAGYACSQGIQTVMFGPTSAARGVTETETISTEFAPVSFVREFTKIYAHTFMTLLG